MAVLLDLARLFAGVALLAFAAYTDGRWRRAPNVLWVVMAALGLVLLSVEAALDWPLFLARWPYLAFVAGFAAFIYAFWWLGLIAGGADAKALMALGLLVPFPIALAEGVPRWQGPMPGSFTILGNSLLLFLAIPLAMAVYNASRGHFGLLMFLGTKREAASVRRGHLWPMETVAEDGTRRTRLFASRMAAEDIDKAFERVQALGSEKVWVSPKIPFMIPLLGGFIAAFTAGDLLLTAIQAVLS